MKSSTLKGIYNLGVEILLMLIMTCLDYVFPEENKFYNTYSIIFK